LKLINSRKELETKFKFKDVTLVCGDKKLELENAGKNLRLKTISPI